MKSHVPQQRITEYTVNLGLGIEDGIGETLTFTINYPLVSSRLNQ